VEKRQKKKEIKTLKMEHTNLNKRIIRSIAALILLAVTLNLSAQKRFYYDESGNKVKSSQAVSYKDITKNGEKYKVKEYYASNDKLKLQGSYLTSAVRPEDRHGRFTTFYENGSKEYEVRFKKGKEEGEYICMHDNGKEKAKGNYAGGKETGDWIYYYDNGQVKGQGKYFAGKYNGDWTWYFEDGVKKKEARYKNGVKDGAYITYHKNSQVEIQALYEGDSLWGVYQSFWSNGKKSAWGKYYNNKRDSSWLWFHENGNKSCRVNYEKGEFQNGDYYNEEGVEIDKRVRSGNLVKLPKYPGGLDKFSNLILNRLEDKEINLKAARKVRYEKTMTFSVELDATGKPTKVVMISPDEHKPYGDPFDVISAVRTAMSDLPEFTPKRAYNRYVESAAIFVVKFDAVTKNISIAVAGLRD